MRSILISVLVLTFVGCTSVDAPIEMEHAYGADPDVGLLAGEHGAERTVDSLAPTQQHSLLIGAPLGNSTPGGIVYVGQAWRVDGPGLLFFPVSLPEGCVIEAWTVRAWRNHVATTFSAYLQYAVDGISAQIGPESSNSTALPGAVTLTTSGVAHVVSQSRDYSIRVRADATLGGDSVFWARATYSC